MNSSLRCVRKVASYEMSVRDHVVVCEPTAAMTVTLIDPAGRDGRLAEIENRTGAHAVTVVAENGALVGGEASVVLTGVRETIQLRSFGGVWVVTGRLVGIGDVLALIDAAVATKHRTLAQSVADHSGAGTGTEGSPEVVTYLDVPVAAFENVGDRLKVSIDVTGGLPATGLGIRLANPLTGATLGVLVLSAPPAESPTPWFAEYTFRRHASNAVRVSSLSYFPTGGDGDGGIDRIAPVSGTVSSQTITIPSGATEIRVQVIANGAFTGAIKSFFVDSLPAA